MSDWYETTLVEQAPLQRGFDITQKTTVTGDIPVISSGGISYYTEKGMVKGPGVVVGRKGTLGSVYYSESDY